MKHPSPRSQREKSHNQEEGLRENARLMEEEKKELMPVRRRNDHREIAQMEEIKFEEVPRQPIVEEGEEE